MTDDRERLSQDLDTLFSLHVSRGGKRSEFRAQEGFQRDFAACAFAGGSGSGSWKSMVGPSQRGSVCASRAPNATARPGRDPRWNRASVGFLLLAHSIEIAFEEGMDEYRFLRGGEAFKYRFANADPGLETIGLSRGLLGRVTLAAAVSLGGRDPQKIMARFRNRDR